MCFFICLHVTLFLVSIPRFVSDFFLSITNANEIKVHLVLYFMVCSVFLF